MKTLKIKDHEELLRDTESQAVINTDMSSLELYRARRERERNKDSEISSLKQEINEIKDILKLLVEKIK